MNGIDIFKLEVGNKYTSRGTTVAFSGCRKLHFKNVEVKII